jgi:glutamate synthase domain-containing protein 2
MRENRLSVNLDKIAYLSNFGLVIFTVLFAYLGEFESRYYHFATVPFVFLTGLNVYYRHIQKNHALLSNYGIVAQLRYLMESIGPEFRQYLYSSDTEERPFNREIRSEIYRKSKQTDSSSAFGSQLNFTPDEFKLRHSMFPVDKDALEPFSLTLESKGSAYELLKPIMISAMSYGALGQHAVRALARGAKKAGIVMNTGEGGLPKYHLMEGCDLIFQLGTAKFGARYPDGRLHAENLEKITQEPAVKMLEIKFSQGAKPGKGGLLPKEKITDEIAELRGVDKQFDILSPPHHLECKDIASTVRFIAQIQEIVGIPVGIKLCVGQPKELDILLREMIRENTFPAYISIDGSEGGTGAAPKSFMDHMGLPLFEALPLTRKLLVQHGLSNRIKVFAAGKLVTPGKQILAMCSGADACYSARGFLLALGCIQALSCNTNKCPVGITTHNPHLQRGLDIENRSERILNYVNSVLHDQDELRAALGVASYSHLSLENIRLPYDFPAFITDAV